MSVDQLSSRKSPRRPDDAKVVRYNDYIDAKIQSTRRTVKLVDLATSFVALAAGVLAYLLVAAVAEHWIFTGGYSVAARTALFALLMGGIGYFSYRRLWPLFVWTINPVYAARTIEQATPSLKNSLVNLLLFRQRRSEISDAVYRTLEEQAAQRLTRAPAETSVDRSLLIRLGYVLVAVVAVVGAYKVLSPKDPLVSAERVLMPWADIVPASRVAIKAVTPGSVTVSRGEFVDVSAEVRGIGDDDEVVLRYTTDDGQLVGKAIPMKPEGDGRRFGCRISDESEGTQRMGLTRNLRYRLEAGDARSLDYTITVVAAPSILVERVDYHYPAYTGYVDRSVDALGDLRAIEGTRVTIHAKANGPIREADVDFDADGRPDLRMSSTESEARASFELSLREDRQTPQHGSYVLRFTNDEGRANRDPVKHSINVVRDQDPEAAVLVPKEKAIDVRLDDKVAIEVEARDPDFLLSVVRLRGEASGRSVIDEPLLKASHRGRFTARYSFVPNAHGLHAGDVVQYWVEAADNRSPKTNMTATERRMIRIVSPNPARQPPPDRVARNDKQQPQPGEQQNGGQQEQKDKGGAGDENGNANKREGDAPGGQQKPNDDQRQGDKETRRQGEGGESASADGKSDAKPSKDGSTKNSQGSEKAGNENKSGEKGQGGQQAKPSQETSDQQKPNGEQTGAGASGGQSSKDAAQPAGTRPVQDKEPKPADGGQQKGEKQTKPVNDQTPVSSEGDNDGEVFERIQQHLERNGQLKDDGKVSRDAERSAESKPADNQRQGDKETRKQGDGEKTPKGINKNKPEGEGKSANGESASADGKDSAKRGSENHQQKSNQTPNDRGEGPGAKTRDDDTPQPKEPKSDQHEQEKSPGGQQTASKCPAGAGDEQKSQGAPNSQPEMKPTEKRQQSPSKDGSNQQEPPAGARGKRESDSQGDQGGDKAGGGEEGGGQKAPREGTGSSGQNQSADEGAGESAEKGKGDTSPNAGRDAKSDHKNGSPGSETKGEGSKQKDGSGNKPGGKAGGEDAPGRAESSKGASQKDKETGRQGDKESGKQGAQGDDAGNSNDNANNTSRGGASGGGGQPGAAVNPQPSITGAAPDGDAANLEYARKQTDLVLEKLADQLNRNKVDDRLLKQLGWTQEEMRRFVERWQHRKEAAQRDDPAAGAAKRELDDALRSLGLHHGDLRQTALKKDTLRDLRDGYRGPVPLEYQERLRAYNQGVSRTRRDGE